MKPLKILALFAALTWGTTVAAETLFTSVFDANTGATVLAGNADNSSGSTTLAITDWTKDASVSAISGLSVINNNNGVAQDGGFAQLQDGATLMANPDTVFINENANSGTAPRQRGFSLTFTTTASWDLTTLTILSGHASGAGTDQSYTTDLHYHLSGGTMGAPVTAFSTENYGTAPAYHTVDFALAGTTLGPGTYTLQVYQEGSTGGSYASFDGITLTATPGAAPPKSISVNFAVLPTTDEEQVDSDETSVIGITGTVPVNGSSWNNLALRGAASAGAPGVFTAATQGGNQISLADSSTPSSGVSMTSNGAFYSNYANVSGTSANATGDAGLMQGFINFNNTETLSLSGLSAWAPNGYRVYAFFDIGSVDRTYAVSMTDGSNSQTFWTADTAGTDADADDDGVMEWKQSTATTSGTTVSDANYAVFGSFTGNTLTISGDALGGTRATLNGFQIVANSEPVATINAFTATPDVFDDGQTVTLAWNVTDADSVDIDQGVGTVAAIGTLDLTPSATTTWTLTATRGGTQVTATATATKTLGAVDVYLLGGQSNMQGLGQIAELTPQQLAPPANVFFWNGSAFEPLVPGTTQTASTGQFGPEIGFATGIAKLGRPVYLIKYSSSGKALDSAWSGTSYDDHTNTWKGDPPGPDRVNFYPGLTPTDPNQGTLYKNGMLPRFEDGIQDIINQGGVPTIRGFLWMQGEQDSKMELSAGRYAASLKRLRDRLAEDLSLTNLPMTYGQVLPYSPPEARFTFRDLIRAQQAAADRMSGLPEAIPNARMVSTDTYPIKADHVHYDTAGQLMLGTDFATAIGEATLSQWQQWQHDRFGANAGNPLIAGDHADPDKDGIVNLLEYATGTNPNIANAHTGFTNDFESLGESLYLRLSATKNPAATDIQWSSEASGNLSNPGAWSSLETTVEVNTASQFTARDNIPVADASSRFLRAKITLLP